MKGKKGSLLGGVAGATSALLGISDLRHRGRVPDSEAATHLASVVFKTIAANWRALGAAENVARSLQNWRWHKPVTTLANRNHSPEVTLERALARAFAASEEQRWSNQVPVASGLVGSGDRRRAIDLVALPSRDHTIFVELKIASDTPAYAAVELLGYAALWLLTRAAPARPPRALLDATRLDLVVLAPAHFYRGMAKELGAAIDAGARTLGVEQGVDLRFGFAVLDPQLTASPLSKGRDLIAALDASVCVAR